MKQVLFSCIALVTILLQPYARGLAFEFRADYSTAFDIIDLFGDGQVVQLTDHNSPPGYGPDVLRIEGKVVIGLAQGLRMTDGTIVALYHENDSTAKDADGIIAFRAKFENVAEAYNTKTQRPHAWFEQDNDAGIQFRAVDEEAVEKTILERSGEGLITDPWNVTGWIWQKVQLDGETIRAKYWPAQLPEPDAWAIEATYDGPAGDRVGIRVNTGDIHLAYFAADAEDIPISAPAAYLHSPLPRVANPRAHDLTLFLNSDFVGEELLSFDVRRGGKTFGKAEVPVNIAEGHVSLPVHLLARPRRAPEGALGVPLSKALEEGLYTVTFATGSGTIKGNRTLEVMPVEAIQKRLAKLAASIEEVTESLAKVKTDSAHVPSLRAARDAAQAHLDRANHHFEAADLNAMEMSARFAVEALTEFRGYKSDWLRAIDKRFELDDLGHDDGDARGIVQSDEPKREAYSLWHNLRFSKVRTSAQSFVMGHEYELTIPWAVDGATPDKDYTFEVRLVSPLGNRVVAQSTAAPTVPTSQWEAGKTYEQRVVLVVLPEDHSPNAPTPSSAPVLDEWHNLVIRVADPETGASFILGNEPGPQPDLPGQGFHADEFYVASTPIEVHSFNPEGSPALGSRNERLTVRNVGDRDMAVQVLFRATSDTGRLVHQDLRHVAVQAGAGEPIEFDWLPQVAGRVTLALEVIKGGNTLTEARRTLTFTPPKDYAIVVRKSNSTVRSGDRFHTPVTVNAGNADASWSVEVLADGRNVGGAEVTGESITVAAEPWFGYYDVQVDCGTFRYDERVVATTVISKDGQLLVNGEPFIVKGTNVHGMEGHSPVKTAAMMRTMRALGFNAWRGDYPARWQVDLAYELNTVYSVLGPFSVTSSGEVFGRQGGPPLATTREISRLMAERYRDSAGVLLWNSCNEITGETIDFVVSQYPVYRAHDPYQRPVHYANLFGQDVALGQDVMSVNNYYQNTQSAESRHPIIAKSLDVAREHGVPLIFTEFNSWAGAVHSTGVEALDALFVWGLDQGMAGGFQYMDGDSDRHPGVFDQHYNTHRIYDEALVRALADAEVSVAAIGANEVTLSIRNKRRFWLRDVRANCELSGASVPAAEVADIEPEATVEVVCPLPESAAGPVLSVTGTLDFVTHHGFRCSVSVNAYTPRAKE